MRTRVIATTAVAGLVVTGVLAAGLAPSRAEDRDARSGWGRSRTVAAAQTIEGDYFAFGPLVTISGTVNGDVYTAAGQVLIEGRVNGDVIAAGGRVSISGSVAQDVRVVGGQVTLSGEIGRNVTLAGGTVELTRAAVLRGGLVAAGGSVHVAAPVGRSARVAAGSLILSSRIGQDVDAAAGSLTITSSAEIGGDVRYVSGAAAAVDPGARIRGQLSRSRSPELPRVTPVTIAAFLLTGALVLVAVSFVSTLVLGLLSVRFLPRYHASVVAILRERPWEALGVGLLAAVVTPVACLLLLASVVGAPLGLILAASYAILLYWGRIFVAAWIGGAIFRLFRAAPGPGWTFLLGLVAYYLLALIPLLGWLVVALAVLFGLGAELIGRKELFVAARRQELL